MCLPGMHRHAFLKALTHMSYFGTYAYVIRLFKKACPRIPRRQIVSNYVLLVKQGLPICTVPNVLPYEGENTATQRDINRKQYRIRQFRVETENHLRKLKKTMFFEHHEKLFVNVSKTPHHFVASPSSFTTEVQRFCP